MNNHQRDFFELCAVLTVVAALLVCTAIAGCTSPPTLPTTAPKHIGIMCTLGPPPKPVIDDLGGSCRRPPMPLTCGDLPRDGSYLLLGCKL